MTPIDQLREKYKPREDERFFRELWEKDEYQSVLSRPLHTVLDIGALAGEFAAYIYDKADVIYALEPFPPHFQELEDNVREFGLTKIKPFQLALFNYTGTAKFSTKKDRGGNCITDEAGMQQIEVPVTTLAQFMKDNCIEHVDVIKIDVENNEVEIFGSHDFKDVAYKIDCIIGEHLDGCIDRLKEFGFCS
jgi:FkbM family methyltransferase